MVVSDVIKAVRRTAGARVRAVAGPGRVGPGHSVDHPHDPLDEVVDVGEVAPVMAVVEDLDRLARQDTPREQKQRHVGATPRPVHREEPEPGDREAVQMAVGMGHQLIGLLGRGVERHRVVDVVVYREGHAGIGAVNRAGRGVHEVLDAVVSAALQDGHEPHEVGVHVGMGMGQGVAHTRLRGEVHDPLRLLGREDLLHRRAIGDVDAQEPEPRVTVKARQAGLFQAHLIVVVEVVEPDDLIAPLEQAYTQGRADETRGPRH